MTATALAAVGQVRDAVERLHDAVDRQDLEALACAITDDCVFEDTRPPHGDRHSGNVEVVAFFRRLFATAAQRRFDVEELVVAGDRATVLWRHHWVGHDGRRGEVRGVDVFRVHDGRVAEKLSYVKG